MKNCPICNRELGDEVQSHHLKPKTFKSRTKDVHEADNKIDIHKVCHQKIHATFSEKDLFDHYHTVERIINNEEIEKFVKYIKKKPLDYYDKNDDTKGRKKKRKR